MYINNVKLQFLFKFDKENFINIVNYFFYSQFFAEYFIQFGYKPVCKKIRTRLRAKHPINQFLGFGFGHSIRDQI